MSSAVLGELIERAAKECGSQKALAERLNVLPHRISEWKSGALKCPPEDVALIADIAGLPAEDWLVRATLWKHEGSAKGERLKKAVGRLSALTTEAPGFYSAAAVIGTFKTLGDWVAYFPQCILC